MAQLEVDSVGNRELSSDFSFLTVPRCPVLTRLLSFCILAAFGEEKRVGYLSWLSFIRGRNKQERMANGNHASTSGHC